MQIITELEQVARGAYCGSLFYHGFNGFSDSSILIRTMTRRNGWIAFPAGGGVVAQSDPAQEYAETLHKAQGMLRSLP
jgi:para-aminobenzoate synthetase component 1